MPFKIARAGRDPVIAYAASELKRCLSVMFPARESCVLLYPAYESALTDVIWLRVDPELAATVADPAFDDGFVIDIHDSVGCICATNPRSVLIGVYALLRSLGCAWIRPGRGGEIIPKREDTSFDLSMREFPTYRHRAVCIEGAVSATHVLDMIDWLPKLGLNGYYNQFRNPVTFYDRWYRHLGNSNLPPESMTPAEIEGLRDQSVDEIKRRGLLYHAAGHGWTCEPFGIPGESWDTFTGSITDEQKSLMAQVNGVRDLWKGVTLNTNLCYSNPAVRRRIADSIADYVLENRSVDCLHVWLADGSNNHCECDACRTMLPADWYVMLLNEIDAALTAANLPTRIVFLVYVDLLWAPEKMRLTNPGRFILMFAPITRSYSTALADAPLFDEAKLPPYERNRLRFPSDVGENLAWLRQWKKNFPCDSFDFDYHLMWDYLRDPGADYAARVLFSDMQNLDKVGLNGMVSCQNQRVFFPSALMMHVMTAGLWSKSISYEEAAENYFRAAFGTSWQTAQAFLTRLSEGIDPRYLRCELPIVNSQTAECLRSLIPALEGYKPVFDEIIADPILSPAVRSSWEYLRCGCDLYARMAAFLADVADGDTIQAKVQYESLLEYVRSCEAALADVLDVFEFQYVLRRFFEAALTNLS